MPTSYSGQGNAYSVANGARNTLRSLGNTFVSSHDGCDVEIFGVRDGSWFDMTWLFGDVK